MPLVTVAAASGRRALTEARTIPTPPTTPTLAPDRRHGASGPASADPVAAHARCACGERGFGRLLARTAGPSPSRRSSRAPCRGKATLEVVVDRVKIEEGTPQPPDGLDRDRRIAKAAAPRSPSCSADEHAGPRPSVFSERFECRTLRHRLRDAAAAPLLVQQPVRRLRDLSRLRQRHRARHGPRRARRLEQSLPAAPSSPGRSPTTGRSWPS